MGAEPIGHIHARNAFSVAHHMPMIAFITLLFGRVAASTTATPCAARMIGKGLIVNITLERQLAVTTRFRLRGLAGIFRALFTCSFHRRRRAHGAARLKERWATFAWRRNVRPCRAWRRFVLELGNLPAQAFELLRKFGEEVLFFFFCLFRA
jgi:hypothetical protein